MQKSQGHKQDNINRNFPTILEEDHEGKGSAISTKYDSNIEDMELAHGGKSETINDIERGEEERSFSGIKN